MKALNFIPALFFISFAFAVYINKSMEGLKPVSDQNEHQTTCSKTN